MRGVVTLGEVPWSRSDLLDRLEEFTALYERRPIRDNWGGMFSPHVFFIWFALGVLKPKAIIENGVWKGQGTWFFEQACPEASLYCIDPDLSRLRYRSKCAEYFTRDFSTLDWSHLPKEETVIFFDDHQDACRRLQTCKWFGFKHAFFDDNYPPLRGDCYSLKKAFLHTGFGFNERTYLGPRLRGRLREAGWRTLDFLGFPKLAKVPPNDVDARYLRENLEVYYEFPPIFKTEETRWKDAWDEDAYPTHEPLLTRVDREYQRIFLDEAVFYTWMCYARLK